MKKEIATSLPPNWQPNDHCQALAQKLHLDVATEAADFVDWTTAKAVRYADWHAAFRSHLRRRDTSARAPQRGPAVQTAPGDLERIRASRAALASGAS